MRSPAGSTVRLSRARSVTGRRRSNCGPMRCYASCVGPAGTWRRPTWGSRTSSSACPVPSAAGPSPSWNGRRASSAGSRYCACIVLNATGSSKPGLKISTAMTPRSPRLRGNWAQPRGTRRTQRVPGNLEPLVAKLPGRLIASPWRSWRLGGWIFLAEWVR